MADIARPSVQIVDFDGLMENVDPRDVPDGAAEEQVNATCFRFGELSVRNGLREVTFENT